MKQLRNNMGHRIIYIIEQYTCKVLCLILLLLSCGCSDPATPEQKLFSLQSDLSMPRNRVVIIIPGTGQKTSNPEYHRVGDYYKSQGITPLYVDIDWKHTGLANIATAASQIGTDIKKAYPDSKIFLFGFSFGAVIAFKLSESINPAHTLLCSMSPVFAEDRKYLAFPLPQFMWLVTDYSSYYLSYSHDEGRGFVFLYGDREFLINKSIIEHRKSALASSKTVTVRGVGHNISDPVYLAVINNIVKEIP